MDRISLLIDARNALYRAIYAAKSDNRNNIRYHNVIYLLRQITSWMRKYQPDTVHLFWDAPRLTVWRRAALETYKDRSNSQYVDDITEDLKTTTEISNELFGNLNVRQYYRDQMEADDLIYAAACVIHPKPTIIVSTDSDMVQIPYMIYTSKVYDPKKDIEVPIPKHHPALYKSVVGDKADRIPGYKGIGPKKGIRLLDDVEGLQQFLDANGRDIYHRNLLLTDLSLCPKIMSNKLYIQKKIASKVAYDQGKVRDLIKQYKINGLDIEFSELIFPFQKLK